MGMPLPTCDEAPARVNFLKEREKKLEKFEIRKEDMNRLVMNFLVTEGLVDAAKKFEEESGTKYSDPPRGLIDREAVKEMLYFGDVDEAIKIVCSVDPQIIHSNVHLQYHLHQQNFTELLIRESLVWDKVDEALDFAHEKIVPIVEKYPEIFSDDFEISMVSLLNEEIYGGDHGRRTTSVMLMEEAILQRQIDQEWLTIPYILKMLRYVEWEMHGPFPLTSLSLPDALSIYQDGYMMMIIANSF